MLPLKTKASAPAGTVAKTAAPAATAGSADTVRCAGAGTKAMLRRRQMAAAKMQRQLHGHGEDRKRYVLSLKM